MNPTTIRRDTGLPVLLLPYRTERRHFEIIARSVQAGDLLDHMIEELVLEGAAAMAVCRSIGDTPVHQQILGQVRMARIVSMAMVHLIETSEEAKNHRRLRTQGHLHLMHLRITPLVPTTVRTIILPAEMAIRIIGTWLGIIVVAATVEAAVVIMVVVVMVVVVATAEVVVVAMAEAAARTHIAAAIRRLIPVGIISILPALAAVITKTDMIVGAVLVQQNIAVPVAAVVQGLHPPQSHIPLQVLLTVIIPILTFTGGGECLLGRQYTKVVAVVVVALVVIIFTVAVQQAIVREELDRRTVSDPFSCRWCPAAYPITAGARAAMPAFQ
jgi:hypothetical protein